MRSLQWKNTRQYNLEDQQNVRMEVKRTNPRDNQQACKPNLRKYQKQVGGRMWQFNRGMRMISHITLRWWSCLMRWRRIVTCDKNYACLWLRSSTTKVWARFEWFQEFRIFRYVKKILKSSIKKFPINIIFGELVCEITKACVKMFNGFIECFS